MFLGHLTSWRSTATVVVGGVQLHHTPELCLMLSCGDQLTRNRSFFTSINLFVNCLRKKKEFFQKGEFRSFVRILQNQTNQRFGNGTWAFHELKGKKILPKCCTAQLKALIQSRVAGNVITKGSIGIDCTLVWFLKRHCATSTCLMAL